MTPQLNFRGSNSQNFPRAGLITSNINKVCTPAMSQGLHICDIICLSPMNSLGKPAEIPEKDPSLF